MMINSLTNIEIKIAAVQLCWVPISCTNIMSAKYKQINV